MSWVAVGTAAATTVAGTATKSLLGDSGGQAAQGAANVVGGALSAQQAQQFGNQLAQTANPFGQYQQQWSGALNNVAGSVLSSNYGAYAPVANQAAATAGHNFANQTQQYADSSWGSGMFGSLNGIGNQLAQLVQDPSSIYNTPQYQAAFGQGQNAVNSTLAAQGLNASGNQLAALQNYGQSFGQNAYNTQLSQLSGLYSQGLAANQQGFNQVAQAGQMQLANNQNAFSQAATAGQMGLNQNNQYFNQLSQLAGLSSGSPAAAAAAQSNVYGQVASSGQAIGQGIGQLTDSFGNIISGLASNGGQSYAGQLGGTTSVGGNAIAGSGALFGAGAGMDDNGWNYGGSNSWGF